jgi:hypothetical protein
MSPVMPAFQNPPAGSAVLVPTSTAPTQGKRARNRLRHKTATLSLTACGLMPRPESRMARSGRRSTAVVHYAIDGMIGGVAEDLTQKHNLKQFG